jgi:hypothetical protein
MNLKTVVSQIGHLTNRSHPVFFSATDTTQSHVSAEIEDIAALNIFEEFADDYFGTTISADDPEEIRCPLP